MVKTITRRYLQMLTNNFAGSDFHRASIPRPRPMSFFLDLSREQLGGNPMLMSILYAIAAEIESEKDGEAAWDLTEDISRTKAYQLFRDEIGRPTVSVIKTRRPERMFLQFILEKECFQVDCWSDAESFIESGSHPDCILSEGCLPAETDTSLLFEKFERIPIIVNLCHRCIDHETPEWNAFARLDEFDVEGIIEAVKAATEIPVYFCAAAALQT